MTSEPKIVSARITALRKKLFDPMREVYVTLAGASEQMLFTYYPDEISFWESEFIGLTLAEAEHLKFKKDVAYLRS